MALDFERLGYYDRAATKFIELFRQQPTNGSYYNGVKRNLERLGRFSELVTFIEDRLKVVDDIVGRADLGSAYYKNGQEQKAEETWKALLQRYKRSSGAYAQVALAYMRNNLFDEAISTYKKGRDFLKNQRLFAWELATAYASRSLYKEATQEFLKFVGQSPRQASTVQRRLLQAMDEESQDDILGEIQKHVRQAQNPSKGVLQIYANCLKKANRHSEALTALVQVENAKTAQDSVKTLGRDVFNFADEMIKIGKPDVATEALQGLLNNWPHSPYAVAANYGLAEAYLQAGEGDKAIASLDGIIGGNFRSNYVLRAHLLKGDILLNQMNAPERALEVYTRVYQNFKNREARKLSIIALGDVQFRLGDFEQAEARYNEATAFLADNDIATENEVRMRFAEIAFSRGKYQEAVGHLEEIDEDPKARAGDKSLVNDALDFLLLIEQNLADSLTALPLYAEFLQHKRGRNNAAAIDTLETLILRYPGSMLAPQALMDVADLHNGAGNLQGVVEAYARILKTYATSIFGDEAMFKLGKAYEKQKNTAVAIETYEKLLKDFPLSIFLENARARIRLLRDTEPSSLQ